MSVRDSLQRLSGDSLVYGFGQISGKAVHLLLVPVLTRALLPQQYGVAELVLSYSASALLVLLLYAADSLDITDKITAILDSEYKNKKK